LFQKSGAAIRTSSAVSFSCSLGRSKKPPQLAHARFQIFGVNDGSFSWHWEKIAAHLLFVMSSEAETSLDISGAD